TELIFSASGGGQGVPGSTGGANRHEAAEDLGGLTMFRLSTPRERSSALLLWEPAHRCLRPRAPWMSCSCLQMSCGVLHNQQGATGVAAQREKTSSWASAIGSTGKLVWKRLSSRLHRDN
uniref:Uncharacterized protein n=1 Tax=Scleropages formosus TaxID=113540 RepID=A0A8C9RLM1_SCLFO